ncbi:hypothetical protein GQ53DRAFT_508747 [Thozetella sp. PMI_491]|nr:hypothetical protein GQ53DRAFT_508747 [Thozetella sp. PMI_491]
MFKSRQYYQLKRPQHSTSKRCSGLSAPDLTAPSLPRLHHIQPLYVLSLSNSNSHRQRGSILRCIRSK